MDNILNIKNDPKEENNIEDSKISSILNKFDQSKTGTVIIARNKSKSIHGF